MKSSSRTRCCSVDICRYLCAVLVVAIHAEPFSDTVPRLAFLIKHVVARFAVPFFFAIAGYFYSSRCNEKTSPFLPYIKRLLSVYGLWFLIYLFVRLIEQKPDSPAAFLLNAAKGFFFDVEPSHFWYLPALIYCTCLYTLTIHFRATRFLLPLEFLLCVLGVLGGSFLEIGQQIPLLKLFYLHPNYALLRKYFLMAPSYFILGVICSGAQQRLSCFSTKKLMLLWCACGIFWFCEVIFIRFLVDWNLYTGMTLGLYCFTFFSLCLLLRYPMPRFHGLARCCRALAGFTYYAHAMLLRPVDSFFWNILHIDLGNTRLFLLCVLIPAVAGAVLYKWNNKWINHLLY